jgi:hypothetical protein
MGWLLEWWLRCNALQSAEQVMSVGVGRRDATCCANIFLSKDGEGDLGSVIDSELLAINFFLYIYVVAEWIHNGENWVGNISGERKIVIHL